MKNALWIPKKVEKILSVLEGNGFESYVVGGCVRDSLLGRSPNDWDITTKGTPEQVKACFSNNRVINTGLKHGTVTLLLDDEPFEITTFRQDGEYLDYRRPKEVSFVTSIREDLQRRDFTVNAMAFSPKRGLMDPFSGQKDLEDKVIRCVGRLEKRFREDALRIMRCLRFASQLGFSIDNATFAKAEAMADLLQHIAAERIQVEFVKLLCGIGAKDILDQGRNIIAAFIPEIRASFDCLQENPYHIYDVYRHSIYAVGYVAPTPVLRLAAFFHDIGKPVCKFFDEDGIGHFYYHEHKSEDICRAVMNRLRFDNKTKSRVCLLVKKHGIVFQPNCRQGRRLLSQMGEEAVFQLIQLEQADVKSQNSKYSKERLERIEVFKKEIRQLLLEQQCFSLQELEISGRDLLEVGIPQGPQVGRILKKLLDMVLEEQLPNQRDVLLEYGIKLQNKGEF